MLPMNQGELIGMRTTVGSVMTSTIQIWRRTTVSDPGGGQTDTYIFNGAVKGFYYKSNQLGGTVENQRPDLILVSEDFTFIVPVRSPINHDDRLKVDERTFEVKSLSQSTDGLEVVMQVGANEVT